MIIIGVTGNTGAGKSTVSTIIKNNLNTVVVDADNISRQLMKPNEEYYNEILNLFGKKNVLHSKTSRSKNKINRTKVAQLIFGDDEKRKALNDLTFKYVGKEIKKQILENKEREYIILDIPLLYEGGYEKICNYVIAVVADETTKIERICLRDKLPKEEVVARLNAQNTDEFFKSKADYIIDNSGKTGYNILVRETLKIIHNIKDKETKKKEAK